MEFKTRGPAQQ